MSGVSSCEFLGFVCKVVVSIQVLTVVLPWLYRNIIGPSFFGSAIRLREMGSWAVVTGATEGIGKAYAKQLAKRGLNIVLVSRNLEKLQALAEEIEKEFKIQTKVVAVDFTGDEEIYKTIEKALVGLEIGILVNNVGISYPHPDYFLTMKDREILIENIIKCNVVSVTNMCGLVMPQMVERRRGIVINISSLAAVIPNPMLSFYAASKAFVDKLSDDLQTEYKSRGIIVQSVMPGYVATNMSKIKKPTWMAPSPDRYVTSALNTLGIADHTTGYYPHALLKLAIDMTTSICPAIAKRTVLRTMENIKARALRKSGSSSQ